MKSVALAFGLLAMSGPAWAADGVAGHWTLDGKFERFAYQLDCRFTQTGDAVGGVCTDVATSDPKHKPQGSHTLTSGKVDGDTVKFTYKTQFLAIPFSVNYAGVVDGDHMKGTIAVPGWHGTFTAVRD